MVTKTAAPTDFRQIFVARVEDVTIALSHLARSTRARETQRPTRMTASSSEAADIVRVDRQLGCAHLQKSR
jgi:hypothetical protein